MTDTLRETPPLVADGSLRDLETPALLRRIAGVPARADAAGHATLEAFRPAPGARSERIRSRGLRGPSRRPELPAREAAGERPVADPYRSPRAARSPGIRRPRSSHRPEPRGPDGERSSVAGGSPPAPPRPWASEPSWRRRPDHERVLRQRGEVGAGGSLPSFPVPAPRLSTSPHRRPDPSSLRSASSGGSRGSSSPS